MGTGRACYTALVTIHTCTAHMLTGGSPVTGETNAGTAVWQTGGAVLTEAALVTVTSPCTLWACLGTAGTSPPWQTLALPAGTLAAVCVEAVTPLQAAWPELAHRA